MGRSDAQPGADEAPGYEFEIRRNNRGYLEVGLTLAVLSFIVYAADRNPAGLVFTILPLTVGLTLYRLLPRTRIEVSGDVLHMIDGRKLTIGLSDIVEVVLVYGRCIGRGWMYSYLSHLKIKYVSNGKTRAIKLGTLSWNPDDISDLYRYSSLYNGRLWI